MAATNRAACNCTDCRTVAGPPDRLVIVIALIGFALLPGRALAHIIMGAIS